MPRKKNPEDNNGRPNPSPGNTPPLNYARGLGRYKTIPLVPAKIASNTRAMLMLDSNEHTVYAVPFAHDPLMPEDLISRADYSYRRTTWHRFMHKDEYQAKWANGASLGEIWGRILRHAIQQHGIAKAPSVISEGNFAKYMSFYYFVLPFIQTHDDYRGPKHPQGQFELRAIPKETLYLDFYGTDQELAEHIRTHGLPKEP